MILFFREPTSLHTIAVETDQMLKENEIQALTWLFEGASYLSQQQIDGYFVGPRREMITPWSTTAVEITQNMNIQGIRRIEEFFPAQADSTYDPMLQARYNGLDQQVFTIDREPDPIVYIEDLAAYNIQEGLALSPEEIREKYGDHLKEEGRVEEALSGAMANYMFLGLFDTEEEARDFARDVLS